MNYFRRNFDGCELIEIHYAGDERCLNEKDWRAEGDSDWGYNGDHMVFYSEFYVEPNGEDGRRQLHAAG